MKEYYFLIREDGSMVWKVSGHGPVVYHSIAKVKQYGKPRARGWRQEIEGVRILHIWIDKGVAQTQWIGWAELDEY